ncbi:MAG: B12-binding domain-containing radical SAM protein [Betaproteobacteria bacterium]|nr:B12-binding domain-containing radical SAM protein [Betaproteobacteria bacterium]
MKITFIKPNIGRQEHSLYVDEGRMEPLMLAVLAGMTPSDVEVAMYDDRMEPIPYDEPTNLAAITVETYTARRAYEIAAEYRARGVPVILGGMHPTLLPEEAQQHADSIFLGDAETVWAQVVGDAKKGRLQKVYLGPPGIGQVGGIMPRRDLFKGKGYLPLTLMQYSRGCRFACKFCAVSQYFERKTYIRRIDEVLQEITEQDRRFIFFIDDNIASDRKALRELCRALIPLKIHWVSQASLDVTRDLDLMDLMTESGCMGNVTGFESITPESLRETKKSPNIPQFSNYKREVEVLRNHGMQTWAAFTLGYDGDTYESILATMDFALENRFTFAAFNILMPYPGTPLYWRLEQEGRLLYDGKWWLHPEYRFNSAAFVPKKMTPDELTEACHIIRKKFNSIPSLVYRFSDVKTNLRTLWRVWVYWYYTTIFRKEVYKKHGMRFGLK